MIINNRTAPELNRDESYAHIYIKETYILDFRLPWHFLAITLVVFFFFPDNLSGKKKKKAK